MKHCRPSKARGKTKFVIRYFRCPVCNSVITAGKRKNRQTPNGHIKTLYCPICKETRECVQFDKE